MVPTPAPNSRRPFMKTTSPSWTNRFCKASASRLNRKTSLLTLASCAFLLPTGLSTRSQAEPTGPVAPANAPATAPQSVSSPSPSSPTSAQTNPSQPTTPIGALAPLPASSDSPPSSPSPSQLPSQLPSQPLSSPETSLDTAANPSDSSPSAISAAPLANPVEKAVKTAAPQPTIRVRAVVSGREQQGQIAVTPKMTVGQALAAMGISLAVLDRVTPDVSARARDGLLVRITRISAQKQTRRTPIPAELRYKPTTSLPAGAKATVQDGQAGAYEITERVWKRDGKETRREFVSRRIARAPQHKVVALGVNSHLMPNNVRPHRRYAKALSFRGGTPRDRMIAPANPNTFAPVKSLSVLATGYSAGPAGGAVGNWTATGVRCTYGAVAVDPRLIPLGSKLYIEGYGYGFACDTGGAIKGHHIDLAFNSPSAAFRHGKRRMKVWILGQ